MSQLILTVIAIALAAFLAMVGVSYVPWWHSTAESAESVTKSSLRILEQAYDVYARMNNGTQAPVTADVDGGFSSNFLPILKILPATVPQFQWKYGQANGLNYFCMESTAPVNEGALKGILRAKSVFSETQVYVDTACGSQTNITPVPRTANNIAVTMYVAFVPGISK